MDSNKLSLFPLEVQPFVEIFLKNVKAREIFKGLKDEKEENVGEILWNRVSAIILHLKDVVGIDYVDLSSGGTSQPLYSLFSYMYDTEDPPPRITDLIRELREKETEAGPLLLCFLTSRGDAGFKTSVYEYFCSFIPYSLRVVLTADLRVLREKNYELFFKVLPSVTKNLLEYLVNNVEFLDLVFKQSFEVDIREFVREIEDSRICLFRKEGLVDCFQNCFILNTKVQSLFWKLVTCVDIPVDWMHEVLVLHDYRAQFIERMRIVNCYKNATPTKALLQSIMTCRLGQKYIVFLLDLWYRQHEEAFLDALLSLLKEVFEGPETCEEGMLDSWLLPGDTVLEHLEHLRTSNYQKYPTHMLFLQPEIKRILKVALTKCQEASRHYFQDLFIATIGEEEFRKLVPVFQDVKYPLKEPPEIILEFDPELFDLYYYP